MDLQTNDIRGKPPDVENRQGSAKPLEESGNRRIDTVSGELRKIADWLSKVRFRRQWFGGLDEKSVWTRIRELNAMYEEALRAERIRYDVLLEEYRKEYSSQAPDQCGDSRADRTATKPTQSHIRPAESG